MNGGLQEQARPVASCPLATPIHYCRQLTVYWQGMPFGVALNCEIVSPARVNVNSPPAAGFGLWYFCSLVCILEVLPQAGL